VGHDGLGMVAVHAHFQVVVRRSQVAEHRSRAEAHRSQVAELRSQEEARHSLGVEHGRQVVAHSHVAVAVHSRGARVLVVGHSHVVVVLHSLVEGGHIRDLVGAVHSLAAVRRRLVVVHILAVVRRSPAAVHILEAVRRILVALLAAVHILAGPLAGPLAAVHNLAGPLAAARRSQEVVHHAQLVVRRSQVEELHILVAVLLHVLGAGRHGSVVHHLNLGVAVVLLRLAAVHVQEVEPHDLAVGRAADRGQAGDHTVGRDQAVAHAVGRGQAVVRAARREEVASHTLDEALQHGAAHRLGHCCHVGVVHHKRVVARGLGVVVEHHIPLGFDCDYGRQAEDAGDHIGPSVDNPAAIRAAVGRHDTEMEEGHICHADALGECEVSQ